MVIPKRQKREKPAKIKKKRKAQGLGQGPLVK